ncbi:MAG: nucleoside triphosphate pyrophosphohydrolase [Lentisphaeria bacterium]|nr:nucleoside triphosphate pyrophosphohydrolase [Lentisphaeria bacterium]
MTDTKTIDYAALPPTLDSLVAILERLRAPGGCPWDREQTRETLSRCLAEECAEFLEAVDHKDIDSICDELGDLLMNVILQAVVAREQGDFTLADVFGNVNSKLVRRHAHVFGDATAETATDVLAVWEKIKSKEKNYHRTSVLDGVPCEMSSLNRAEKLQRKAAKVGFDWDSEAGIIAKIEEELAEFKEAWQKGDQDHADEELGDLLFAVSNLTRFRKRRTAEELLRSANDKFIRRFQFIEQELAAQNIAIADAGIDRMETLWQQAKSITG